MGSKKRKNCCIDCGVLLANMRALRCKKCNGIYAWKTNPKLRAAQHTEDYHYKLSATSLNMWKNPEHRCNISNKSRKQALAQWADPNSNLCKAIHNMDYTPNKPSKLELKFKAQLDNEGIYYVQQYRPEGINRFYDFYIMGYNALVEIDGLHWHYSDMALQRGCDMVDAEKDRFAYERGYTMVRIPENELTWDAALWMLQILQQEKYNVRH